MTLRVGRLALRVGRMALLGSPTLSGVSVALCRRITGNSTPTAREAGRLGGAAVNSECAGTLLRRLSLGFDWVPTEARELRLRNGKRHTAEEGGEQHGGKQGPRWTPQGGHYIATQTLHTTNVEPRGGRL